MQLSLNGATTMTTDLPTDISAAAAAGFDAIEVWVDKLWQYLKTGTMAGLRQRLHQYGVQVCSLNSIEHITFRLPGDRRALQSECETLCQWAKELECPTIVVVPSPRARGVTRKDVLAESTFVLQQLSRLAEPYQVNLAFEFLGYRHCSVRTLAECNEIVTRVNRPNVGLVLDTFHFYVGGSLLQDIASLDPERLFILHINDAENRGREQLEDRHRLLPGQGILPLTLIWQAVKDIGYDGVVSVELFRPEYWEWNPETLAKQAKEAVERVLGRR